MRGRYSVDDIPHGVPVKGWCPVCRTEETLNRHGIRASLVFAGSGVIGSVFRCARCDTNLARPSIFARLLKTLLLLLCLAGLSFAFGLAGRSAPEFLSNWREAGLTLWVVLLVLIVICAGAAVAALRALMRIWRTRYVITHGYEVSL